MVPRLLLPLGLALFGVLKAGAVVLLGRTMGAPLVVLSVVAALWITGPATCAWLLSERRRARAGAA